MRAQTEPERALRSGKEPKVSTASALNVASFVQRTPAANICAEVIPAACSAVLLRAEPQRKPELGLFLRLFLELLCPELPNQRFVSVKHHPVLRWFTVAI